MKYSAARRCRTTAYAASTTAAKATWYSNISDSPTSPPAQVSRPGRGWDRGSSESSMKAENAIAAASACPT